jgi:hypothetical protein
MTFAQAYLIGYELLSQRSFCVLHACGAQYSSLRLAQYQVSCKLLSQTPLVNLEPQIVHVAGSKEFVALSFCSLMWGLQSERVF